MNISVLHNFFRSRRLNKLRKRHRNIIEDSCRIDASALVAFSRLSSRVKVGKNASVKGSAIGDSCHISNDTEILAVEFSRGVRVAHHAAVRMTRIDRFTSVGRFTKVTHSDIGKFCAISWDATINAVSHPYQHLTVSAFPYSPLLGFVQEKKAPPKERVLIKNDVWIGANSVIMPGMTIGNGAVIGANAVVTKDVPDYAIVAGVPARVIKYRFSEALIERLRKIEWWNFSDQTLKENIGLFQAALTADKIERLEAIAQTHSSP